MTPPPLPTKKKEKEQVARAIRIYSVLYNERIASSLYKLKFQRFRPLQRSSAPTHAARLNMRFCSCALARARLFMEKMLTYNIFSESGSYVASFESNFSFLRQFCLFYLLFLAQSLMTSLLLEFAHMQYQPWHQWFLHIRKKIDWFWPVFRF